jgi:hypothetical protein
MSDGQIDNAMSYTMRTPLKSELHVPIKMEGSKSGPSEMEMAGMKTTN